MNEKTRSKPYVPPARGMIESGAWIATKNPFILNNHPQINTIMDQIVLKLAIEHLNAQVEKLTAILKEQQQEIVALKKQQSAFQTEAPKTVREDEFINTKEVQRILGVCYNTLQEVIRKGFLHPIRINQRRIRFSKQAVLSYLNRQG